jgi:hypothetical protein
MQLADPERSLSACCKQASQDALQAVVSYQVLTILSLGDAQDRSLLSKRMLQREIFGGAATRKRRLWIYESSGQQGTTEYLRRQRQDLWAVVR